MTSVVTVFVVIYIMKLIPHDLKRQMISLGFVSLIYMFKEAMYSRLRSSRIIIYFFFFSSRRRHTRLVSDWSSDVCSSDLFLIDFGSINVMPLIYDEKRQRCNILVYDYVAAKKSVARIVFSKEGKGRKHPDRKSVV